MTDYESSVEELSGEFKPGVLRLRASGRLEFVTDSQTVELVVEDVGFFDDHEGVVHNLSREGLSAFEVPHFGYVFVESGQGGFFESAVIQRVLKGAGGVALNSWHDCEDFEGAFQRALVAQYPFLKDC